MKEFYKNHKRTILTLALVSLVVFLSACGASTEAIGPESEGFWDGVIIYNLSRAILWLSDVLGGSYGLAIIVFTALGQIILLPLTNYQQKSMEKTQELQPQLEELRAKYSSKDEETQGGRMVGQYRMGWRRLWCWESNFPQIHPRHHRLHS